MPVEYLTLILGAVGIIVAALIAKAVLKHADGNERMQGVAAAIREGANAFLRRQYKTIGTLAVVLAIVIFSIYAFTGDRTHGVETAAAFLLGALGSGVAGWIGMSLAVRVNLKTAAAAEGNNLNRALQIALRGGSVTGLLVVALSLLGITGLYIVYRWLGFDPSRVPPVIVGYGFGASFVALFAQLGGGIYTKAADVGADLVGKVEAGIPEDDPRNPAVVADLVGDTVGDCAGRGADLFESIAAENLGAMIIGVALFPAFGVSGILFPLALGGFGILASILGVLSVRVRNGEDPMKALNRGFYLTALLAAIAMFFTTKHMLVGPTVPEGAWLRFFLAGLVGLAMSVAFLWLTQYYTEHRYRPVQAIARASETGPATNIIAGLAVGFENVGLAVVAIGASLWGSYALGTSTGLEHGGIYGTAVATMGMLATAGYILAMDNFGPITDNAGGIVEMSEASEATRAITDKLDAVGNTTKALTKGYAVGSAALAAFLLFSAYLQEAHIGVVDLAKVPVFLGAMIGAALVFVFSSFAIRAVGKTAGYIITEVRRQFHDHPGIMAGTEKPDYAAAVDITTRGALKNMVLPGALAVVVPIATGLLLRAEAAAGMLMVGTIAGVLLALVMNNGGGAWDNAKKYIESGEFIDSNGVRQGKKTAVHAASVVGDTVGDPFKDTAGPSLHVLVKLLSTLTLVLAALFI